MVTETENNKLKQLFDKLSKLVSKEIFSVNGRISRKQFIIRFLVTAPTMIISSAIFIGLMSNIYTDGISTAKKLLIIIIALTFALVLIVSFYILIVNYVKRLHDLGFTGWIHLAVIIIALIFELMIPYADHVIMILYTAFLMYKKGVDGINKYGNEPISDAKITEISE